MRDPHRPAFSLSFPKREECYESPVLFPFFGLLAEGDNKAIQCRLLRIDENDHFTRLLKTCGTETIGVITVQEATIPEKREHRAFIGGPFDIVR